ncbi:iron-regulated protein [bacterium]|nr:iron-regulated protein [bacterium]
MLYLILTLCFAQTDVNSQKKIYVQGYAEKAFSQYSQAALEAQKLNSLVQEFIANPSQEKMELAKKQWVEARKIYSQTEVYRFYDSPIDDADGPEGMLNAWPIDEAYIDSVKGKKDSGIINNLKDYPVIDKNLLMSLNEKSGEKNISTGWHAIEFLLWGQDFNANGPGQRSFQDYVDGIGLNADRRRTYLATISSLIVEQLQSVAVEWTPGKTNNYFSFFIQDNQSLGKIVESIHFFAGEELSVERMYVAYDTQDQEDEHSCFSDTTHNDLFNNFKGLKGVILDSYNGVNLVSLIGEKESALADKITAQTQALDIYFNQFPAPFDQAIFVESSRQKIKLIIDSLQTLADDIEEAKKAL